MIKNQDKLIQEMIDYYDKRLDDWAKEVIKKEKLAREKLVMESELVGEEGRRKELRKKELSRKKEESYETEEYLDKKTEDFLKLNKGLKNKKLDEEIKTIIEVNGQFIQFIGTKRSHLKLDFSRLTIVQKWMVLMLLSNTKGFAFRKFELISEIKGSVLREPYKNTGRIAYYQACEKEKTEIKIRKYINRLFLIHLIRETKTQIFLSNLRLLDEKDQKIRACMPLGQYSYNYLVLKYGEKYVDEIRFLPIFPYSKMNELEIYRLMNNTQKSRYCDWRRTHIYKLRNKNISNIASDFFGYANYTGFEIQYACHPAERSVYYPSKTGLPKKCHYSLDGIDDRRKIIIEWFNPSHWHSNGWGRIEDFIRERRIRYFYPFYYYIEINEKKYFPNGRIFGRERYKMFAKIIEDIRAIIE